MYFRRETLSLVVFVMFVAILCHAHVEATRVLQEDFASTNHLATDSSVYEKAKLTMACWLERLASGPSPRGRGH
ncbi:hypothetical protein Vadar_031720 [Vaccinium darrowii]|uniref:Uncharacterized protein n=1 Tax=Vaccinium darrowii TaxID=229202 RepID=A0ACB7Z1X9_9ERIC|nr:hypothetical protein Vadar_031720 [Vaccinium darrowii]